MKTLFDTFIFILAAVPAFSLCFAQTAVDLRTQSKSVDFSAAPATKPFKTGTSLPALCTIGESFFKSNAAAGENLYGCTAPNVWTKLNSAADVLSLTGQAGKVLTNDGDGSRWTAMTGDVDGTPGAAVVRRIQGNKVSSTAPADRDVLQWNMTNARWEPLPNNPVLNTGAGIAAIGPVISIDDAMVPMYLVGAATPTLACDQGRVFYTNLTSHTLYFCSATNTWTPLSIFGHTHSANDIATGTFNTSKITPGTDGQCLITSGGSTVWGACPGGGSGSGGGTGDVGGPTSAEDYGLSLYNGVTGKQIKSIPGLKSDAQGNLTVPGSVSAGAGTAAGEAQFCPPSSSNCISWLAPASRTASTKLTLPAADPAAARQVLAFGFPSSGTATGTWQAIYAPGDAIASSDLPLPTTAAGGKVKATSCSSGQFVNAINTDSSVGCGTPSGGTGGSGGGGGSSYSQAFTNQTTVSLTHNLGTKNVIAGCYDGSDRALGMNDYSIGAAAPYDVTVHFTTAQTGRCVVVAGAGKYAAAFTSQTSMTIAGTTHNLGSCDVQVEIWDAASPARRVEPNAITCNSTSKDIVIGFAAPQSGKYIIQ